MKVEELTSRVWLFATPWTTVCQAPLSKVPNTTDTVYAADN